MPANADLQCQYFISSSLKKKKSHSSNLIGSSEISKIKEKWKAAKILIRPFPSSANNSSNSSNNSSTSSSSSISSSSYSASPSSSFLVDSISFVKYDKNPMEYLKQKYQTLKSNSSSSYIIPKLPSSTPISIKTTTPITPFISSTQISFTSVISSTNSSSTTSSSSTSNLTNGSSNGEIHKKPRLDISGVKVLPNPLPFSPVPHSGVSNGSSVLVNRFIGPIPPPPAASSPFSSSSFSSAVYGPSRPIVSPQASTSSASLSALPIGPKPPATAAAVNNSKSSAWLELKWSRIRKIGGGLLNLGNNCYLNATLQCLAYTPALSQWLVAKPHSPSCKFRQMKGFCSMCEVEHIICEIFTCCNGFARPNNLCQNIKKISTVFGIGTQEDASEFLTTLLESMAKSIRFTSNINHHNSNGGMNMYNNNNNNKNNGFHSNNNNNNNNNNSNNNNKKATTTILDDIFSFQFRSRITCGNCHRVSDTIENTNTWPIDVKALYEIKKGMMHFLREEVLEGANAYKCDKCNKKTKATKKYSIRTAPNVLVIHLKRFDISYAGKLSHFVQYPEALALKIHQEKPTNAMSSQSPAASALSMGLDNNGHVVNYKLYGVLVHLGYTSHSGHYFSYVKGHNDQWYKVDDQKIKAVQTQESLQQSGYLLFYSRE